MEEDECSQLKTPQELTVSIDCVVEHVKSERTDVRVANGLRSNKLPVYSGDHYKTTFKVLSDTPVKVLTCRGMPPFQAGDTIRAYVMSGEVASQYHHCRHEPRAFRGRELRHEETSSRIEKIVDGKPVAEYISH